MAVSDVRDALAAIPEGYAAVPVSAGQAAGSLRICVLVRREPDPVAGHLMILRDLIDGRVILGCVVDARGAVQGWVELWVQDLEGLSGTAVACREALSNAVLDRRWEQTCRCLAQTDPASLIRTGWETEHPLPTYIDLTSMEPVHPTDAQSGEPWTLCRDDALLEGKGLPAYSTSLHRYLYLPGLGADGPVAPATPDAPKGESVVPATEVTGGRRGLLALNVGGGLMLVRRHGPIRLEPMIDLLSGGSWPGVFHGRSMLNLGPASEALKNSDPNLTDGGWLYLGRHGRPGRIVEAFHLKLRLLSDAVRAVRRAVELTQRPLLNMTADSFQVRLGQPGSGLPFLWTSRAVLCDSGDAVVLPIHTSDAQYFLQGRSAGASVYRPASAGQAVRGQGTVRIRQALTESGSTIVEGTFATQERFQAARYDLIWLRLNLSCGRVDLYGQLEQTTALAAGEWRFRTVGQRFGGQAVEALRAAEGVPIADTHFEIVPLLSTPCDLYSLAVLAVRTLLVNGQTTLAVALDEALSLARQVAAERDESIGLGLRIHTIFEDDPRWAQSLGPNRLIHEGISPEEAFDLIPAEVWWDTLGLIVRLVPGIGPDSLVRDYGDAPPGGIHKVFDPAIEQLDDLLLRTRSLILIDWRFNREVHAVARRHLMGLGGEGR